MGESSHVALNTREEWKENEEREKREEREE